MSSLKIGFSGVPKTASATQLFGRRLTAAYVQE